jgi:succinate dehydrogenase/fumarate reductase flavoprotein subunit
MAAIQAARQGCQVLVVDKGLVGRSGCTVTAEQLAALVPGQVQGDSPEQHYRDTLNAGRGLCRPELARLLAEEAFQRVREFEKKTGCGSKKGCGRDLFSLGLRHGKMRSLRGSGRRQAGFGLSARACKQGTDRGTAGRIPGHKGSENGFR